MYRIRSDSNEDKLLCQVWCVYFTILQFQMNYVLKKAAEVTLLSLITKKTIQPLWTQFWTVVKMLSNCWPATVATLVAHMGICCIAFGTPVASVAISIGRDVVICAIWAAMVISMPGSERAFQGFSAVWISCWICVVTLLMVIKSMNALYTLVVTFVTQVWTSVTVETKVKLYTLTDVKQDR